MRDYLLMTDSCCDMDPKLAEELGLTVLPLTLDMGGRSYRNYLDGRELPFQDFYSRVRDGELATTSAISVGDFEAAMRPVLESGKDILCLCFSSASVPRGKSILKKPELRSSLSLTADTGRFIRRAVSSTMSLS